jgi:hypothetical protein
MYIVPELNYMAIYKTHEYYLTLSSHQIATCKELAT